MRPDEGVTVGNIGAPKPYAVIGNGRMHDHPHGIAAVKAEAVKAGGRGQTVLHKIARVGVGPSVPQPFGCGLANELSARAAKRNSLFMSVCDKKGHIATLSQ